MIKHIVFDMGNVLIEFNPKRMVYERVKGQEERDLILNATFLSKGWERIDYGDMTEEDLCGQIRKLLSPSLADVACDLVMHWHDTLVVIEGMEELIGHLKEKGYRVYLLSNASSRQHLYWDRIPASVYFDGTLISADVKMAKPNADIYEHLCYTYGLKPAECVFIDDTLQNIEAAKSVGMRGIVFEGDVEKLRERLFQILS